MSVQCLASMSWRRALKHFPLATKPIDISPILTAASLAPTSFGVQPFQIYVISNADIKSKIAAAAYQQPQVTECSHLLVFASRNDAAATVERCISAQQLDTKAPDFAKSIRQSLSGMDSASFSDWAMRQTHIALGFSLVAAADLRVGSCPMGGFDAKAVGLILNLPKNEDVAVLLAIGTAPSNAAEEKKANPFPKYNMTVDDLVTIIR